MYQQCRSEATTEESGYGGDGVVPTEEELQRTLARSRRLWTGLLRKAGKIRLGADTVRPERLLHRVPQLPSSLEAARTVSGYASWRLLHPLGCTEAGLSDDDDDTPRTTRTEAERQWTLSLPRSRPTLCALSDESSFAYVDSPVNALAPMCLAWAYILSKALLERQNIAMHYAVDTVGAPVKTDLLQTGNGQGTPPTTSQPQSPRAAAVPCIDINIGRASAAEKRWWCALVTPGHGWRPVGKQRPPWAVTYARNARLNVVADRTDREDIDLGLETDAPPSSAQAVRYLSRLASVYDLDGQAMLALAMALTLPLHNEAQSTVRLPKPGGLARTPCHGQAPSAEAPTARIVRQHHHLARYLTLSSNPLFLSSALWSIFWEPGVDSNHVSAWLAPIHEIVEPLVRSGSLERVAHLFALRRPTVSPLWYGILACGKTKLLQATLRFLVTLHTPWLCRPVPEVAVWTRSPQSFMDVRGTGPYLDDEGCVRRADVWRLRHEFWESEPNSVAFRQPPFCPWPPFGVMPAVETELPVRAHLQCDRHEWTYVSWTWLNDGHELSMEDNNDGVLLEQVDNEPVAPDETLAGDGDDGDGDDGDDDDGDGDTSPPECQRAALLDQAASRKAVSNIFRWAASEMEPSGKAIYNHPWVQACHDLDMEQEDRCHDDVQPTKLEAQKSQSIREWIAGLK
ncbi:hypothetical protein SPI_08142 [Niveomyces insectorum RCEF 264]|uniref:Uncharacterized protein n=1 Tax=Niveomyces insectorum RCEF 264 TaxID=1081102 RepID=A0A162IEC3_9HYPO|nr:hypothetical protein SPI_08142 [Niveomyces insectorum RCEF 264]